jgi:hypothetical protein
MNEGLSEVIGPFPVPPPRDTRERNGDPGRREEATDTQYIHPITRFQSVIVMGGQSIILTTLTDGPAFPGTDDQRLRGG